MYTPEQSEAILDVAAECPLVHQAFEFTQGHPDDQLAAKRLDKEIEVLRYHYIHAWTLGVDEGLLMRLVAHNLPEEMTLTIELPRSVA